MIQPGTTCHVVIPPDDQIDNPYLADFNGLKVKVEQFYDYNKNNQPCWVVSTEHPDFPPVCVLREYALVRE